MLTKAPSGYVEIMKTFGNYADPHFESKYLKMFKLPYTMFYEGNQIVRARCHILLVDNFTAVLEEIKSAGLNGYYSNFAGIYNNRPIRGGRKPSCHSWGIAIDCESSKYPLGSSNRFPKQIIDIFKKYGFTYGGDFKGRKDGQHFQFARNY